METIINVTSEYPCFGDHKLVMAHLCINRQQPQITLRRDWRKYSKDKLCACLTQVDWTNDAINVQQVCNDFENKLIHVIDMLVPISEFYDNKINNKPCPIIKRNLNI